MEPEANTAIKSPRQVLDYTSVFDPHAKSDEVGTEITPQIDNLSNRELALWIRKSWTILAQGISAYTGQKVPNFNPGLLRWVKFKTENTLGTQDPYSGKIHLSGEISSQYGALKTLAHEMVHLVSQRRVIGDTEKWESKQTGLATIGNGSFSKNIRRSDWTNRSCQWALDFINEAIVEQVSSKVLNLVASNFGYEPSFSPSSYVEARHYFDALITNIHFGWNDQSLRADEGNLEEVATQIGLPMDASYEEIEAFVEKCIWQKRGLLKFARLINFIFGRTAFRDLYQSSIMEDLSDPDPEQLNELWQLISAPSEIVATRKKNVAVEIVPGKVLKIDAIDLPDGILHMSVNRNQEMAFGLSTVLLQLKHIFARPREFSSHWDLIYDFNLLNEEKEKKGAVCYAMRYHSVWTISVDSPDQLSDSERTVLYASEVIIDFLDLYETDLKKVIRDGDRELVLQEVRSPYMDFSLVEVYFQQDEQPLGSRFLYVVNNAEWLLKYSY